MQKKSTISHYTAADKLAVKRNNGYTWTCDRTGTSSEQQALSFDSHTTSEWLSNVDDRHVQGSLYAQCALFASERAPVALYMEFVIHFTSRSLHVQQQVVMLSRNRSHARDTANESAHTGMPGPIVAVLFALELLPQLELCLSCTSVLCYSRLSLVSLIAHC